MLFAAVLPFMSYLFPTALSPGFILIDVGDKSCVGDRIGEKFKYGVVRNCV